VPGNKMKIYYFTLPLFILLYISCYFTPKKSDNIQIQDLFGKYYPDFGQFDEYIQLKEDMTFEHYYVGPDSIKFLNSGYWELILDSAHIKPKADLSIFDSLHSVGWSPQDWGTTCRITFYGYRVYFPESLRRYEPEPHGHIDSSLFIWETLVYKYGDEIILRYDGDFTQNYKKINSLGNAAHKVR